MVALGFCALTLVGRAFLAEALALGLLVAFLRAGFRLAGRNRLGAGFLAIALPPRLAKLFGEAPLPAFPFTLEIMGAAVPPGIPKSTATYLKGGPGGKPYPLGSPPWPPVAILADRDILALRREGRLHLEPFQEGNLTPNGYDLTIAEVYVPRTGLRAREGRPEVPPTTWFAVGTLEVVELAASHAGQLWIRTSWARRGVLASFGRIDAGFRGNLTLGAFNGSHEVLVVPVGETFAQLVLEDLSSPAKGTYRERSGRYQDQRGVTMAKD